MSDLEIGRGALRTGIAVERWFRAHLVIKHRLCYDTALSPPMRPARDVVTIYLMEAGCLATSRGVVYRGPCALVLAESEFERLGAKATTFRSWGDPAVTMDIRLRSARVSGPIGIDCGPRPLSPMTWAAHRHFISVATPREDSAAAAQAIGRLLVQLVEDGVLLPGIPPVVPTAAEPVNLVRLWEHVAVAIARFELRVTFDEISVRSGLSARQLRRDFEELARTFDLPGGFRDGLTVMRLRAAVALLSAPEATVAAVAIRVGYGSSDALGRAFRDAGLPSPIEVRQRLRYQPG